MRHSIVNLALFQLFWLVSILGAARGLPYLGPLLAVVWLSPHLFASRIRDRGEWKLVVASGALGFLLDSLLVAAGFIEFPPQAALGAPTTLWMVGLWMGFATLIRGALAWLRGRYLLGALLGAAGGPLAYWGGARLGAVSLVDAGGSLVAVGVEWMVAMPLLLAIDCRLERIERARADARAPASGLGGAGEA